MAIKLSNHFSYGTLLRFTLPSIVMMIFTSVYGVVDGLFVSNFVGKIPFAAVNLIMPYLMIFSALGFMLGTGGSALVSKTLGEGKKEKANSLFSLIVYSTVAIGVVSTLVSLALLRRVAVLLGAEGELLEICVTYGRYILPALPGFMLQTAFQSFMVTAEKPKLGLWITVAAGVTNIVFDALFVAVFKWGVIGAAVATAMSQYVGGLAPLIYFARKNSSLLRLGKCEFDGKAMVKICTNGSSELMTNLSLNLVNMLYNFQLMRFAKENGVAAYGVIMYVNFIFISIFVGYSIGSAPVIGYHYGSGNNDELKSLKHKSLVIIAVMGVVLTALGIASAHPLAKLFVGYDQELFEMTKSAFMIYCISFLVMGFNIFASSFFTALNNGAVSAAISFLRTLLFQVIAVMCLPMIFDLNGIWFAITAAELAALAVSVFFFKKMKNKYRY